MKFFIDSADVGEIRKANEMGCVDGATTNPSLLAKVGRGLEETIREICSIVDGPVSAECVSLEAPDLIKEGRGLAKIHDNVVVKIPMGVEGMKAVKALTAEGIRTNVTLCFSANQALLAAKAGASFISPFIGRIDDMGIDGMELIAEIKQIYDNYGFPTEILAASIRTVNHVKQAALIGAHVATVPPATLKALVKHPLTDKGLETFLADWAKTGQKIG
jgi:transaldolase